MKKLIKKSVFAAAENPVYSGKFGEDLRFNFDESTGTLTISGTGDMPEREFLVDWPWSDYKIKTVKIEDGVTSISECAFSFCSGLSSVSIPDSVTRICRRAFGNCYSLSSVNIPNSVTSIGDAAFVGCKGLKSIKIPNSVTRIGAWAFANCDGLTSVRIPNSVTSIGSYAFEECDSLQQVSFPDHLDVQKYKVFEGCPKLNHTNNNVDDNKPNYDSMSDEEIVESMNGAYQDAVELLSNQYDELFVEPSTQLGVGSVFAQFVGKDGVTYSTYWDYEDECQYLISLFMEGNTHDDNTRKISEYIKSHLEDAEPSDENDLVTL